MVSAHRRRSAAASAEEAPAWSRRALLARGRSPDARRRSGSAHRVRRRLAFAAPSDGDSVAGGTLHPAHPAPGEAAAVTRGGVARTALLDRRSARAGAGLARRDPRAARRPRPPLGGVTRSRRWRCAGSQPPGCVSSHGAGLGRRAAVVSRGPDSRARRRRRHGCSAKVGPSPRSLAVRSATPPRRATPPPSTPCGSACPSCCRAPARWPNGTPRSGARSPCRPIAWRPCSRRPWPGAATRRVTCCRCPRATR